MPPCSMEMPFGVPVVPEVNMVYANRPSLKSRTGAVAGCAAACSTYVGASVGTTVQRALDISAARASSVSNHRAPVASSTF